MHLLVTLRRRHSWFDFHFKFGRTMSEAWRNTPETVLGTPAASFPWWFLSSWRHRCWPCGENCGRRQCFFILRGISMVTGILNGAVYTHLPIPVSEQPARWSQCCGVRVRGGGEGNRGWGHCVELTRDCPCGLGPPGIPCSLRSILLPNWPALSFHGWLNPGSPSALG